MIKILYSIGYSIGWLAGWLIFRRWNDGTDIAIIVTLSQQIPW